MSDSSEKSLKELIAICDEICATISRYNVGAVLCLGTTLKTHLHQELAQFAIYLEDTDGVITAEEQSLIHDYLNLTFTVIDSSTCSEYPSLEIPLFRCWYCVISPSSTRSPLRRTSSR